MLSGKHLLDRLDELKNDLETIKFDIENKVENGYTQKDLDNFDFDEYKALLKIENEISSDESLYDDSDFADFIHDCYDSYVKNLPENLQSYFNWEALIDDSSNDYSIVTFNGIDYYLV